MRNVKDWLREFYYGRYFGWVFGIFIVMGALGIAISFVTDHTLEDTRRWRPCAYSTYPGYSCYSLPSGSSTFGAEIKFGPSDYYQMSLTSKGSGPAGLFDKIWKKPITTGDPAALGVVLGKVCALPGLPGDVIGDFQKACSDARSKLSKQI